MASTVIDTQAALDRALGLSPAAPPQLPVSTGPKSVSIRHNEIMDFLMMNPSVKMSEVARQFGVTPGWLSQIVHSDVFQALLKEKQDVAFHESVMPLREKMMHVAHQALDRLAERLPQETEVSTLSRTAESVLDRLGYGSKQNAATIINNTQVNVLAKEITEARAIMEARAQRPGVVVDGHVAPIGLGTNPHALPASDSPGVGPALPRLAAVPPGEAAYQEGEAGSEVRGEGA
jgi:hypothetical protein